MAQRARIHKHHIIPRHMGGSDLPENIAIITVEEHAQAHKKLFEDHGKYEDYIAWKALSGQITMTEAKKMAQTMGQHRGGEVTKKIIQQKVAEGTFILQTEEIREKNRQKQLLKHNEGIHNFSGLNEKRIKEGSHNLLGSVTCRNKSGEVIQVPRDVYKKQKVSNIPMSEWEYASVNSFEGKKRKYK